MLAASLLLVTLAQGSAPTPFFWMIEGLGERRESIVVTVTPTQFGLATGIRIKAVTLEPTGSRADSRRRSIQPHKTEVTTEWALRAWFTRPERRFSLMMTLSDGTVERTDPWAPARTEEKRTYEVGPFRIIAPPGITTSRGV